MISSETSQAVNCSRNQYTANFPAERARIEAGYTLHQAAKKLRLRPRTIREIELRGNASMKTARRLARLYRCSGNLFVYPPKYFAASGQRAIQASTATPAPRGADRGSTSAARRYSSPKPPILALVPEASAEVRE